MRPAGLDGHRGLPRSACQHRDRSGPGQPVLAVRRVHREEDPGRASRAIAGAHSSNSISPKLQPRCGFTDPSPKRVDGHAGETPSATGRSRLRTITGWLVRQCWSGTLRPIRYSRPHASLSFPQAVWPRCSHVGVLRLGYGARPTLALLRGLSDVGRVRARQWSVFLMDSRPRSWG